MSLYLAFSRVSFGYESAAGPLFEDLSLRFAASWTGIVGANGCGKTTLLKLAAGLLVPESGMIDAGGFCRYCEQTPERPPENAGEFFASHDGGAIRLCRILGLDPGMAARWHTLSMGERKKIQIGAALFDAPGILCLDEPTNHLDSATRKILLEALRDFCGIGLLVSHDREFLDVLCGRNLFIRPWGIKMRSGGVSAGMAEEELEQRQSCRERQLLKNELKRSRQELQRRREKAVKAENSDSKSKIARYDYDAKGRIDAARVSGRSRRASDLAGAQAGIVERRREALDNHETIKGMEYGLSIPYGSWSKRNLLAELSAGALALGDGELSFPDLAVGARDRIALTGGNGSGKSTLLREIVRNLKIPPESYLYMPQELDVWATDEIYCILERLGRRDYSSVMSVVASLGSRPERVLKSRSCSPGEWRKLFFGLGVLREINLLVMDEPTNHLDLPSIQCLEAALAACNCAILLVSHDRRFIEKTCRTEWRVENRQLRIV